MEGDFIIIKLKHDSPELISKIGFLLGSDEWYKEHNQNLRRQKGKVFYLIMKNTEIVSLCSLYKNQILDCHTIIKYRNKGYMQKLIQYMLNNNKGYVYSGTANLHMEKIFTNVGLKYKLNRGRYRYYENHKNSKG